MSGFPAFPIETYLQSGHMQAEGMTLRDVFAACALIGIGQWIPEHGGDNLATKKAMDARSLWAREQAESLLAELNRKAE